MIELNGLNTQRREFSLSVESLKMERGEFIAVLGNNGSGKSTFLGALAGLLPCAGSIRLNDREFSTYSSRDKNRFIGYLPQRTTLNMPFDVYYVILTGRFPFTDGFNYQAADHEATEQIIEQFDIVHLKNRPFNELSGGEKQRVLLARVLNRDSELLLLDEPLNGIDLRHQHETIDLLKRLSPDKTILVVMHDLSLAIREFRRLFIFSAGALVYDKLNEELDTETMAGIFNVTINCLKQEDRFFIHTALEEDR